MHTVLDNFSDLYESILVQEIYQTSTDIPAQDHFTDTSTSQKGE